MLDQVCRRGGAAAGNRIRNAGRCSRCGFGLGRLGFSASALGSGHDDLSSTWWRFLAGDGCGNFCAPRLRSGRLAMARPNSRRMRAVGLAQDRRLI
jgi:hypothetical protein